MGDSWANSQSLSKPLGKSINDTHRSGYGVWQALSSRELPRILRTSDLRPSQEVWRHKRSQLLLVSPRVKTKPHPDANWNKRFSPCVRHSKLVLGLYIVNGDSSTRLTLWDVIAKSH
eukprot:3248414-Amphidinium_carterae.1